MKDQVKHTTLKGSHFLTVTPDGRKDTHQVAITFTTGTGHDYKETDRAQVSIWTEKDEKFTGTFEDLKGILKAGKQMEEEGIIINGYRIKFNAYWDTYQVNHTESMEIPQNDYKTLQDAINYATNG